MGFTRQEYRAIYFVADNLGYRLMLCRKPYIYYKDKMGSVHKWRMREVMRRYASFRTQKTAAPAGIDLSYVRG